MRWLLLAAALAAVLMLAGCRERRTEPVPGPQSAPARDAAARAWQPGGDRWSDFRGLLRL